MHHRIIAVAAAAVSLSSTAFAGGYVAPVIETAPLVVAPVVGDWQGAYGGLTLGYAFNGDDRIGVFTPADAFLGDLGKAELSGANLGIHVGYRWQRNKWVFGPELGYTAGNIKDEFDFGGPGVPAGSFESKVNHVISLKMKTGYQVQPDMLAYGIAGYQKGDFTYVVNGTDVDYDADGYVLGLGVEKKLSDRMSVTGEWEYNDFGETEVDLGGYTSNATPSFHNLKLGLNFKF